MSDETVMAEVRAEAARQVEAEHGVVLTAEDILSCSKEGGPTLADLIRQRQQDAAWADLAAQNGKIQKEMGKTQKEMLALPPAPKNVATYQPPLPMVMHGMVDPMMVTTHDKEPTPQPDAPKKALDFVQPDKLYPDDYLEMRRGFKKDSEIRVALRALVRAYESFTITPMEFAERVAVEVGCVLTELPSTKVGNDI